MSRSLGIITKLSTRVRRSSMPFSAWSIRRRPSKPKGLVTTPTVRMPISLAMSATMGAAPVPVPPPIPAVMNTISVSSSTLEMALRLSSADLRPTSGSLPAPWPPVSFSPIWILTVALEMARACLSVFTTMNSTPLVPVLTIRLTTLFPPPPTPITLMVTTLSGPLSSPITIIAPPM